MRTRALASALGGASVLAALGMAGPPAIPTGAVSIEDGAAVLLAWAAWSTAGWLAATFTIGGVAGLAGSARLAAVALAMAPRRARAALGVALALSTITLGCAPAGPEPARAGGASMERAPVVRSLDEMVARDAPPTSSAPAPTEPASAPVVRDGYAPAGPAPAPPAEPDPAPAEPAGAPAGRAIHVVRPGDNLWTIAAARVGSNDDAVVAPYWRVLVERNRASLRSGNPNLIYPGEAIELP